MFIVDPLPARAGILDSLWKLISGDDAALVRDTSAAAISMPLLGSQNNAHVGIGGPVEDTQPALPVTQDNALVGARNPSGTLPPSGSDQIVVYTVVAGDTPGAIAERFGITLNTLLWANNLRSSGSIKIGDNLIILPVSGVKYQIKKGDTIETIAKKFKPRDIGDDFQGFVNDISGYNGLAINEPLEIGSEIIIPDGEVSSITPTLGTVARNTSRFYGLPEFIGYYLRPILGGRKTQGIHGYNGVDLANSCGQPVLASAPGTVIVSRTSGWNGGYGRYMVVSHPNNTQTLYAHLERIFANVGEWVNQGASIGSTGSTGRSTGCHVHFEIRGARNPF